MKNYIVTFTNNVIYEDCLQQQQSLREALGASNTFISQLNEEITFEAIDREVENAILGKFDNFICLAEDEDVEMLQNGLECEYGDSFSEILVIPEAFGRLQESDMPQTNQTSTITTNQDAVSALVGVYPINELANLLKTFSKSQSELNVRNYYTKLKTGLKANKQLTTELCNQALNAFKIIVLAAHSSTAVSFENDIILFNLRNINGSSFQTRDMLADYTEIGLRKFLYINGKPREFLVTYRKGSNYSSKNMKISLNEESPLSDATSLFVYTIAASYPFVDIINNITNDISSKFQPYSQKNFEIKYILCGPYNDQQFLPSASICEVAKKIPDSNLENIIKSYKLDGPSSLHAGMPVEDQIISSLQTISTVAPQAQEVVLVVPEGIGLSKLVANTKIKVLNGNTLTISKVLVGVPQWDAKRNAPIYNNLLTLITGEKSDYKNCKKLFNPDIAKGKRPSNKGAPKQPKIYTAIENEVKTGWPSFVKLLMAATSQFLKEKIEKTSTSQDFDKKKGVIISDLEASIKADYEATHNSLSTIGGVGDIINTISDAAIDKFKKSKEESKEARSLKALISTENYKIIKEAFGGKFDIENVVDEPLISREPKDETPESQKENKTNSNASSEEASNTEESHDNE